MMSHLADGLGAVMIVMPGRIFVMIAPTWPASSPPTSSGLHSSAKSRTMGSRLGSWKPCYNYQPCSLVPLRSL